MKYVVIATGLGILALAIASPFAALCLLAFLISVVMTVIGASIGSILLKDKLLHDPAEEMKNNQLGMFIEIEEGRSICIMKGGEPIQIVRNEPKGTFIVHLDNDADPKPILLEDYFQGEGIEKDNFWFALWRRYQRFIYKNTGLYAYIPFLTKPFTYDLPRFVVREEDGKRMYRVIKNDEVGYYTNHVRHQTTTWYFVFDSVDIQKVPFTVIGSAQISIVKGKEREALFKTDSWNVLLDMSLKSVIRSVLRNIVTLDQALGIMSKDLTPDHIQGVNKDDPDNDDEDRPDMLKISDIIQKQLEKHPVRVRSKDESGNEIIINCPLSDFGIDIERVDIIDLSDELKKEDRLQFVAAAIGREKGRAEMFRGQGKAASLEAQLKVLQDSGEMGQRLIEASAFVDGMKGTDGISALAGALTQRTVERSK